MVNVQIDGSWLRVPAGTRLIEACRLAGIEVPHYCYHPKLTSPGSCRMCLVQTGMPPRPAPGQNPAYDHDGYLIDRRVDFLLRLPNYNRDPDAWSLSELRKLAPGASLTRPGIRYTMLASGFVAIERLVERAANRPALTSRHFGGALGRINSGSAIKNAITSSAPPGSR